MFLIAIYLECALPSLRPRMLHYALHDTLGRRLVPVSAQKTPCKTPPKLPQQHQPYSTKKTYHPGIKFSPKRQVFSLSGAEIGKAK